MRHGIHAFLRVQGYVPQAHGIGDDDIWTNENDDQVFVYVRTQNGKTLCHIAK